MTLHEITKTKLQLVPPDVLTIYILTGFVNQLICSFTTVF